MAALWLALPAARVEKAGSGRNRFRLDDGRAAEFPGLDPRLRHLELAWACPPGAARSSKARNVIVAVGTAEPSHATQESLYASVSAVPGRAQLVSAA